MMYITSKIITINSFFVVAGPKFSPIFFHCSNADFIYSVYDNINFHPYISWSRGKSTKSEIRKLECIMILFRNPKHTYYFLEYF